MEARSRRVPAVPELQISMPFRTQKRERAWAGEDDVQSRPRAYGGDRRRRRRCSARVRCRESTRRGCTATIRMSSGAANCPAIHGYQSCPTRPLPRPTGRGPTTVKPVARSRSARVGLERGPVACRVRQEPGEVEVTDVTCVVVAGDDHRRILDPLHPAPSLKSPPYLPPSGRRRARRCRGDPLMRSITPSSVAVAGRATCCRRTSSPGDPHGDLRRSGIRPGEP